MVDNVCEPFMSRYGSQSFLAVLFETGKGSGAALMMFSIGIGGVVICLLAGKMLNKYHYCDK